MISNRAILVLVLAATVVIAGCTGGGKDTKTAVKPITGWESVPGILAQIKEPVFADREYNVVNFGASGDGKKDCRKAIMAAINKCNAEGGGRVYLPAGIYLVNGPIHLKSNVNLVVSRNAKIIFGTDPNSYLPVVLTKWEGTELYNYSPLIYAYQATNVAITGGGTIDGGGNVWKAWHQVQTPDVKKLRQMGNDQVPVCERLFGQGHFLRPNFIQPFGCKNVLIENVTVINSPFWTIHLPFCNNVIVRNVTVNTHNFNDDGCDPDSSVNVLIENCNFDTNDDSIAIKAGRDQDAWRIGQSTENVIIRGCTFRNSWGALAIGSEMSGSVRNVFIEDCNLPYTTRGLHIKSNLDRGGMVENVWARRVKIGTCRLNAIEIHTDYGGYRGNKHPSTYRNFNFEDITCQDANIPIRIRGVEDLPIRDVSFENVEIRNAKQPVSIISAESIRADNVRINSERMDLKIGR